MLGRVQDALQNHKVWVYVECNLFPIKIDLTRLYLSQINNIRFEDVVALNQSRDKVADQLLMVILKVIVYL